jgi:hypothetical protein
MTGKARSWKFFFLALELFFQQRYQGIGQLLIPIPVKENKKEIYQYC